MRLQSYRSFLDQLSTLLRSGIPILEALSSLGRSADRKIAQAAGDLEEKIRAGTPLAEAMGQGPYRFPPAHAAFIGAAERAGELPRALDRLRDEVDRKIAAWRALLQRSAYPMFIFALAVLLPPLYLIFQGKTGEYLAFQVTVFGSAGIAIGLLVRFRSNLAPLLAKVPVLGEVLRRGAIGESLSLLGLLVEAGIGVREALGIAADAARNAEVASGLRGAARSLDAGQNLAGALASLPRLPPEMLSIIATGETAGAMDRSLQSAGRALEESSQRTVGYILCVLPIAFYFIVILVVAVMYIQTMLGVLPGAGL